MHTTTAPSQPSGAPTGFLARWCRLAWVFMVAADVGLGAWGLGAALAPTHLLGPGGQPILPAGFDGYTSAGSWDQIAATSTSAAGYMILVFRLYGVYIVAFSLLAIPIAATAYRRGERWAWWALLVGNTIAYASAMSYDAIVGAIGPFELTEYLGIGLVWATAVVTWSMCPAPAQPHNQAPAAEHQSAGS